MGLYLVFYLNLIILHCDKIILKGSAPNINLAQNEKIVLHRFALTKYRNPVLRLDFLAEVKIYF